MSISRTFVSGGERLIWLGCAALIASSLAASTPAASADRHHPPRALWKAFPLHQRPHKARAEKRADTQAAQLGPRSSSSSRLLIGAAAAGAVAVAGLTWLGVRRRTRRRVARALRDHVEQVACAALAIAVGIGIGLFAGLYL